MPTRPLAIVLMMAALQSAPGAAQSVFAVTRAGDDGGPGTLRWAIEANNRAPGGHRIAIADGLIIRPDSLLPPLKGPVTLAGGRGVVIDGAAIVDVSSVRSCPGENPEQFGPNVRTLQKPGLAAVDTTGVEISGIEVRNFCIGILSWRSAGSWFHHNRLVNNIGGAGIMFSGDDGAGNPTAGRSIDGRVEDSVFIDNGDGLELGRGTEHTLVARNTFVMTAAGLTPSQGIEVLSSNNDSLIDNRFSGFSDGLQIGGDGHVVRGNVISDAAYGITLSGRGVTVADNLITGVRMGIGVRGSGHVLTRNRITDIGQPISRCNAGGICADNPRYAAIRLGIDVGVDGPGPGEAPVLQSAARSAGVLRVSGTLRGRPLSGYAVEVFAGRAPADAPGAMYLGEIATVTDAAGQASFTAELAARPGPLVLTATATGPDGTSEFGPPLAIE